MNDVILSKKISMSEKSNGDIELDICICDFEVNGNNKKLNIENAEDKVKTLINMPLVGKVSKIANTDDEDFTSHNKKTKYELKDGQLNTVTYLDTNSYGVFTDSEIKVIDDKPFVFAKALVWTSRYKNVKEIIQKRFDSAEGLYGSWELLIKDSHVDFEDGKQIEVIDDWEFIGFALLGRRPTDGSVVNPAYKCAKVLQVAEEDLDELSQAIDKDRQAIQSEQESEENKLNKKGGEEMAEENKNIETSALTMNDISKKLRNIVWEIEKEDYTNWYYLELVYPTENIAYLKRCGDNALDEDFLKVSYSIDDSGDISIVSKEEVKMVFVPKESQVDVSEIEEKLKGVEAELSEKVGDIVKLGETIKANESIIAERDKTIAELEVFKNQIEEIQAEQAKQEIAEKQEELKKRAISSGYITEEFIETSERLQKAISELNEDEVLKCVAEEVIKTNTQKQVESSSEEIEVSEIDNVDISTDLSSTDEYEYNDSDSNPILGILSKNKKRR